jgi:hypothetical protein
VDHLLCEHGEDFYLDDPLSIDPNQKDTSFPGKKIKTRTNKVNRKQFISNLERFCSDPNTKFIKDASVRGKSADIYYCDKTFKFVAIRNNISTGKGFLIRAQPFNPDNLEGLECDHKIN